MRRTYGWAAVIALALAGLTAVVAQSTRREESGARSGLGTFNDIVAGDPNEYAGYQVKFTYTGLQTRPTPTLLMFGPLRVPAVGEFTPYQTVGVSYDNDGINVIELGVSGLTIERLIMAMGSRPEFQSPGSSSGAALSIMIERGAAPAETVFEHLADEGTGRALLALLRAAGDVEPPPTRDQLRRFRNVTLTP